MVSAIHPNITHLQLYDDQYLLGPVEEVLSAFDTLKEEMAKIGIKESQGKSKIYSRNEIDDTQQTRCTDDYHLEVIPPEKGLIIAGCPMGSDEYVREELNNIVNGIKSQLDRLQTAASPVSSKPKQDIHTLYCILKYCIASQFNHVLRSCPPSLTASAATKLDDISIKFLSKITNTEEAINNLTNEEKLNVINKIFLPSSKAGMGITSSLKVAKAAYVGSICISAHWMNKIISHLSIQEETLLLPTFREYNDIINEFRETMPTQVENINITDIWSAQLPRIQHIISNELHKQTFNAIEAKLPLQSATVPNSVIPQYSEEDNNIIVQWIHNKNKNASAFLQANPADYNSHMSNQNFVTSYKQRLGLRTIANKHFCICGERLDISGNHFFKCSANTVRNAIRNPAHKHLKNYTKDAIQTIIKDAADCNLQILSYEPHIDNYFPRSTRPLPAIPVDRDGDDLLTPTQAIPENNKPSDKRADIAIKNGAETILIDVTMIEATGKHVKRHDKAEDVANQAVEIKMKKYQSTHDMSNQPNIKFFIAATTTQGALSKDFKKLLKYLVNLYPENIRTEKLQQIYQRLSAQIHKITNDNMHYALNTFGYIQPLPYSYQQNHRIFQSQNSFHQSQNAFLLSQSSSILPSRISQINDSNSALHFLSLSASQDSNSAPLSHFNCSSLANLPIGL